MILKKQKSGFTLIELLVVIAIIGVLSSITMAGLNTARMKARDSRRIADLAQIRNALEMFYDANGYYPRATCGWDCNGYRYSYDASWDALAADLAPYISPLPRDPINSACPPWNDNCYSYSYGNIGRYAHPAQYDLSMQFEDHSNPQRCELKDWRYYFGTARWCGWYNDYIYEASLD